MPAFPHPPKPSVTTSLPLDPRLYVRRHNTNLRETLGLAAAVHHTRHIPWHFEQFAPQKYGYAKRNAKYQARKDRLGLPPLVSPNPRTSGQLRTAMTAFRTITKTKSRARLILRLPFKGGMTGVARFRQKRIGGGLTSSQQQIMHRIAEMEAVASDEQQYINNFIEQEYARRANLPGTPYRIRNRP
jgi:hypothetical protein